MARVLAGFAAGAAVGYCVPKLTVLSPVAKPIEDILAANVPFPKPAVRLTYFDLPGRAEAIRWTCAVGGMAFDDVRVSREEFAKNVKPSIPTGQVPAVEVDGSRPIGQSYAILRFVGKCTGLYPTDPVAALKVDEALETCNDVVTAAMLVRGIEIGKLSGSAKAAICNALSTDILPKEFAKLERLLEVNGSDWLAGSSITVADIAAATLVRTFTSGFAKERFGIEPDVAKDCPKLNAMCANVEKQPAVAKWLADHT